VLQGHHTRVSFSPETGGIVEIVNTTTGRDFISSRAEKPKLWRLRIEKANGEAGILDNTLCGRPVIKLGRGAAELVWKNLSIPGVVGSFEIRVLGRVSGSDGLVHLRLNVENRSDASLMSTVFPEISGLGRAGQSDVAFPKYNWGEMFKGLEGKLTGYYPSADMPMQFCSVTEGNDSIYLAAHDPGALYKTFVIQPGKAYSVETATPNATVAGNDWHPSFDFVLGVYQGDWTASCKLYRKWAIKSAPWTQRGQIAKRRDVSEAVREIGVWLNLADQSVGTEKRALEFRERIGVPIGVHWYNWHSNPFDRDYPDYLPAKAGFADVVKRLQERGIYSMPYINGRLWDTQNRNYPAAKPYASSDKKGEANLEDYQSGTKLAVMCLGHPFWRTNLAQLIDRVSEATGVDGVYIDQVAGAAIAACYNPQHGHTLGRDRWWIDGYRRGIREGRAQAARRRGNFFVAAENNAEPYMDFVDLFLIWIPRSQNDIPMMTMVYSGYTQYFGTNRGSDSDTSFSMLQARDFAWGAQLFWESAFVLAPEQKEKLKILTNLARLRYKARNYLVDGELLNVVPALNNIPTLTGKWGSWTSTLENRTVPSVHGTLWKGGDGSYAVVVANGDNKEQSFSFRFAPAGISRKKWRVQTITASGSESLSALQKDNQMTVIIPARDGVVLRFD
jgi:hypothetical protein